MNEVTGWSNGCVGIYWPVFDHRLTCDLLVSSKLFSRQQETIKSFCCIQNVHWLRQTVNSGLINKALLLNKTGKDTRLSTHCVPGQFGVH